MRPRSPILAVILCLIIISSIVGVPQTATSMDSMGPVDAIGTPDRSAEADDPIGPASALTTVAHLMTESEMKELKAIIGVYDGNSATGAVKGTGLRAPTEGEWEAMVGTRVIVDSVGSRLLAHPGSVDLSLSGYFPVVGNQQLGSCAAWAETYYALGYLVAEANGWSDASLGNPEHLLSPLWTYNLQNGGVDGGSPLGTNTKVAATIGAATLGTMPYEANATKWGSEEAWREAASYRAEDLYVINYNKTTELSTIKTLLASGTPVVFSIFASNFTYYADGLGNRNNIISTSEYYTGTPNHLQTIVGYYDNMSDNGEEGVFKVVNSWGADWGEDGYYYITYDAFLKIADPVVGGGVVGYVVLEDEETTALAVWHFDLAPGRDADIAVSAVSVSTGDTLATVEPYIDAYIPGHTIYGMPYFMCLDISDLSTYLGEPTVNIVLVIGDSVIHYLSGEPPVLSSFRVERYSSGYDPGDASMISDQASGLPAEIPCSAAIVQRAQIEISTEDALEWQYGALSFVGTQWVGVDSGNDSTSSLQSGDVGDMRRSMLIAFVYGPGTISFDWSVSSEDTYDFLRFYVDGVLVSEISGEEDWTRAEHPISAGLHNLTWSYEKDEYVSEGDDCGWLDNVDWSGLEVVQYEGFEGGMSGWTVSDTDAASGVDTWGTSGQRSNSGRTSAWCAASGNGSNGNPNHINGYYDTYMSALMVMSLPDLTPSGGVHLSFYYWALTGGSSLSDHLCIEAYNVSGGWAEVWTQPSVNTNGWVSAQAYLPNDTTMVRFCFYSDGMGGYEGVYLDDILLTYADIEPPTSSVNLLPEFTTSSTLSLDCTVEDGAISWDGHVLIYYRIGGSGDYVLYTTASNPFGMWSSTMVDFELEEVGGSEGLYQFYSIAIDGTGNVEEAPLVHDASTTFDRTAPTTEAVTSGSSAPAWNAHGVEVTLSPSDSTSGVYTTIYRVDEGPWTTYAGAFTISTEGSHTVRYYSTDVAGNVEITRSIVVNVDLSGPSIEITSPSSCSYLKTAMVSWDAFDISGIATKEVSTDGSTWATVSGTSCILDLDDGAYVAYVRATNGAGLTSTASVSFVLDTIGPTLTIISPTSGSYTGTGSMVMTWTASDASSGIAYYMVSINDGSWMVIDANVYTFNGLADGTWVAHVRAYDVAGNHREASVQFVVDTVAPSLEITSPSSGSYNTTGTVTIEWVASDITSGVEMVEVSIDGGEWSPVSSNGHVLELADGAHTISFRATDRLGFTNEAEISLIVDTVSPTVAVSPTGDGIPIDPNIVIEFSEPMNASSVSIVVDGVERTISWNGMVATFLPDELEYGTEYAVTVSGKDLAGNFVTESWTFNTMEVGNIEGRVIDKDGNVLANATVTLNNGLSTMTDEYGRFVFDNITVGSYSITVARGCYETVTANVMVTNGTTSDFGEITMTSINAASTGWDSTMLMVAAVAIVAITVIAAVGVLFMRKPKMP